MEFLLDYKNVFDGFVEFHEITGIILHATIIPRHVVVVGRKDIDNVVVLVEAVDLVAPCVFDELAGAVVYFEGAGEHFENRIEDSAVTETLQGHTVDGAHGPVANEGFHDLGVLLHQMSCGDATDRSAVGADFTSYMQPVDQELEHALSVDPGLVWIVVGGEYALLGFAVAPIVPDKHITLPSEKKVEPVGVGGGDHPLVDECIGVAHYYRGFVQVLPFPVRDHGFCVSICLGLGGILQVVVELYRLVSGAREEHAVDLGLRAPRYAFKHEVPPIEILLHYQLAL